MSYRNLSPQIAEGMFGGPRGKKGNYLLGNQEQVSGATYGGQGLGMFWYNYPAYISGASNFYNGASDVGSTVEAVKATQTGGHLWCGR